MTYGANINDGTQQQEHIASADGMGADFINFRAVLAGHLLLEAITL